MLLVTSLSFYMSLLQSPLKQSEIPQKPLSERDSTKRAGQQHVANRITNFIALNCFLVQHS